MPCVDTGQGDAPGFCPSVPPGLPGARRIAPADSNRASQIPLDGEPADVVAIVDAYSRRLSTSNVPKLFINADPGVILTGAQREHCRAWPNQTEVTVPAYHFIQEDAPAEIGRAVAGWLGALV